VTAIVAAVGALAWLCFLLLCIGFAQAARRGDLILGRALAAESGGGHSRLSVRSAFAERPSPSPPFRKRSCY
jgi:hypothetical protein